MRRGRKQRGLRGPRLHALDAVPARIVYSGRRGRDGLRGERPLHDQLRPAGSGGIHVVRGLHHLADGTPAGILRGPPVIRRLRGGP
jgi:hypothetical protein